MPPLWGRAWFGSAVFLAWMGAHCAAQSAPAPPPGADCTQLLQAQDAQAVPVCKTQLDQAEHAPATERMARIVAGDEYGVALLAVGHKPGPALEAFNRAIALLPASTVKPDSLQWAVAFWHRATAYQQLMQWDHAAGDLSIAENTLARATAAAAGDQTLAQHFSQLRQRVRVQHAGILERMGRRSEAQKLLATQ